MRARARARVCLVCVCRLCACVAVCVCLWCLCVWLCVRMALVPWVRLRLAACPIRLFFFLSISFLPFSLSLHTHKRALSLTYIPQMDDPAEEALAKCLIRSMVVLESRLEEGPEKEMLVKGGHLLLMNYGTINALHRYWR